MVKNLFKQTPEEEIKKAFILDQAPYLHKWVKISGSLTFFSIILFSFFLDFIFFHYTLTEILKVRNPPLFAAGVALGIAFVCRNSNKINWNRIILLMQLGLLSMSLLLMFHFEIYRQYISTHIVIIAFSFAMHRSTGWQLLLLYAGYICLYILILIQIDISYSATFPNFIIILILPFISHLMYIERKKEFRSRFLLNEVTNKRRELLQQILPTYVITDLEERGESTPRSYENCTIVFTDFVDFTKVTSFYSPKKVLNELDELFTQFDNIIGKYRLQKIKTIGDSYMFASGIPEQSPDSAIKAVKASMEIMNVMTKYQENRKQKGHEFFGIRIGINTGPVIAGMVGERVFSFDIWGDTVNTASRIESASIDGKICISESCYNSVKDYFTFQDRGLVPAKGKGKLQMYFLEGMD